VRKEDMAEKRDRGKRACLAVLMLLFFLAGSTIACPRNVAASTESGPTLVLFTTQKVFAPQQLVTIYANVTQNGKPVAGKLVSFQVTGPPNALETINLTGQGITTNYGLASYSFRMFWPPAYPEKSIFGTWTVVATVEVAQVTVEGTVTFRVGWILQIASIATLNSELMPQIEFFRGDIINFNLTVENIAVVEEPAAITIEAEDAASYPIINITMQKLTFQPGESHVVAGPSRIPNTATIGNATAWAAIYNATLPEEGGVQYSPAISTKFEIAEKLPIHDIGMPSVTVSPSSVYVGERVQVVVTVKNNGTAAEQNCILSVYYNSSSKWILIETLRVALTPGSQENVTFSWITISVGVGLYRINATVSLPLHEVDPSPGDNTRIDGLVEVMTPTKPVPHVPSSLFLEAFAVFMFVLAVVASLVLLLMLGFLRRRRRKKKPQRRHAIIAHLNVYRYVARHLEQKSTTLSMPL
jgi:hypothetical protein